VSSYIRRFLQDPGVDILLDIESVNVLDLDPPASISGVGTGTVLMVGEFENGPFNEPTEVISATDMASIFGGLGYTYGGNPINNPCAVKRTADGGNAEAWNGNGFIQLNGKKFRRLVLARVDTSVGEVTFSRLAFFAGANVFRYNLEPAQNVVFEDGTGPDTATFSAAAAARISGAGVYPTLFVGGETITLGYDGEPDFTVVFLNTDQTHVQIIDRINQFAGFTFASISAPNVTTLTGKIRGLLGRARVVSASAPGVLTALGMTVGTTNGTGNVANIDAVQISEVDSIFNAATAGNVRASLDDNGALRVQTTSNSFRIVSQTALNLGLTANVSSTSDSNKAVVISAAGTYPTLFAGGETVTLGSGDSPNVTVTFLVGDQLQTDVISRINAAMGYTAVSSFSATRLQFVSQNDGDEFRIVGASAAGVLTTLGLTVATTTPQLNIDSVLPAGTRVRVPSGQRFVTMQDVSIDADSDGPYTVKVRPAVDDGTAVAALAGTITQVEVAPYASFSVINNTPTVPALSEAAIDVAYQTAIDSTLDISSVARDVNVIVSARQSNAIRAKLKANAVDASASGHLGRDALVRPPMGTTKQAAKSNAASPGVGATRDERVFYCYPQVQTYVPAIALKGLAGGYGFTANGIIDTGADSLLASVLSQLAPEENPGQENPFTDSALALESSSNAAGFVEADYRAFKAAGICAPRFSDGKMFFQSGVTSSLNPSRTTIARRRMADFIQDSIARAGVRYGKKLNRPDIRTAFVTEIINFMDALVSETNPALQRIDSYSLDTKTGNTPALIARGLYRLLLNARTLSSLDAIVLQTAIGPSVVVTEALPNPGLVTRTRGEGKSHS